MPEIARFIKELLQEDEYGTNFHANLGNRVRELNLATIQQMDAHLDQQADNAQFYIWREANLKVESEFNHRLQFLLDVKRRKEEEENEKRRKLAVKMNMKEIAKSEAARVQEYIHANTFEVAKNEVINALNKSKQEEKARIRSNAFKIERERNWLLAIGLFILLAGTIIPIAVLYQSLAENLVIIVAAIAISVTVSFLLFLRAWLVSRVHITIVTDVEVEQKIFDRQQALKAEEEAEIAKKDQLYREQLQIEKEEKRIRRRERREREEWKAEREVEQLQRLVENDYGR